MMELEVTVADGEPLRVLCLGAHCDDIEIGCGGALLTLARSRCIEATWVVFASDPAREEELAASAGAWFAGGTRYSVRALRHRDGFLPYDGGEVKADFERLKDELRPDLVFTHARGDAHQDHRCVCELTWNTFRDHLVLEYEVPKWDGDLGQPNVYLPLPEDLATRKASLLVEHYRSQRGRQWFAEDVFLSLMRLRGMECRSPSGYAEAFFGRKLCLRS